MISVTLEAYSQNPWTGTNIATFVLTYPYIIHGEVMTHRTFSRNAQSNRAIPTPKMIAMVLDGPFIPSAWRANQKGMVPGEPLDAWRANLAEHVWLSALHYSGRAARLLSKLGVHKQWANRLLMPWAHITVVITSTDWANWFRLRDSDLAQDEIHELAHQMRLAMDAEQPVKREWHLPFTTEEERATMDPFELRKVATGRAARVSYLTHYGLRDLSEDLRLHDSLITDAHWSPTEHCAEAMTPRLYNRSGNFRDWRQYREEADDHFQEEA